MSPSTAEQMSVPTFDSKEVIEITLGGTRRLSPFDERDVRLQHSSSRMPLRMLWRPSIPFKLNGARRERATSVLMPMRRKT